MFKLNDKNIFAILCSKMCGSFLLFMLRDSHAVLSVHCSLVVTCWERADLLALLCVMFSILFVTFPCGVLGQVWYLIVSIPDICLRPYFVYLGPGYKTFFHTLLI